jgi:gliding motility-associated-like protein
LSAGNGLSKNRITDELITIRYDIWHTINEDYYTKCPEVLFLSPESINLTFNKINDGTVILLWQSTLVSATYSIYRDDGSGPQLLGTTTDNQFTDIVYNCDPVQYKYYVTVATERSNDVNVELSNFRPEDPHIIVITINDNGFAEILWQPSSESDVTNYTIEKRIDNSWQTYYTTTSASPSFVDDLVNNPDFVSVCESNVSYAVLAVDVCNNKSPGDFNYENPHSPILLGGETETHCGRKAELEWTAYVGMSPDVLRYIVERSVDGEPFEEIDVVNVTASTRYNYTDEEFLTPGVSTRYRVSAVNGNNPATSLRSYSCIITLEAEAEEISSFNIENVSVVDNNTITLTAQAAPPSIPNSVNIYREVEGNEALIQTLEWDSSGTVTFTDADVNAAVNSYTYTARIFDNCENTLSTSSEFNSLLLTVNEQDGEVLLGWNSHVGWSDDLVGYKVYRYHDGVLMYGYPKDIITNSYREGNPTMDIINITYRVAAERSDGTLSWSNEVLLPRAVHIEVPTAFHPGSLNDHNTHFRPILKNVDPSDYYMEIFNRFGQMVFETDKHFVGWDGSYNGKIQQGAYVYQISYRDQTGLTQILRGVVFLMQ